MRTTENWYLAKYAPPENNRSKLFSLLERHNITVWIPLYEYVKRGQRQETRITRALFTSYFFVKMNVSKTPTDFFYQHPAFGGFVRYGENITPLPDHLVENLQHISPSLLRHESPERARLSRSEYHRLCRIVLEPNLHTRNGLLLAFVLNQS